MGKERLAAFSDGVIAIIITIMVLELKAPEDAHEVTLAALAPLVPTFLGYVLSFTYVAIYWNNHHHLIHTAERVNGAILWANMFLLFWLSLLPFTTTWMSSTHLAAIPSAIYGVNLLMAGLAYFILSKTLVAAHGAHSTLAKAIGRDWKGQASLVIYLAAIAVSFFLAPLAQALYVAVALMWLIPDRRIEKVVGGAEKAG